MHRRSRIAAAAVLALPATLLAAPAEAAKPYAPGSPGIGDPYYPLQGNGGYDVAHYTIGVAYEPSTGVLTGDTLIKARASQNLSRFDLDLKGMTVHRVTVDGASARWTRSGQELVVTPRHGIAKHRRFKVRVTYSGVPTPDIIQPFDLPDGWLRTSDGAIAVSQPNGASTWFPSNDHPADKATFTFNVSVPRGLQVIANGLPLAQWTRGQRSYAVWGERAPMATYLASVDIGHFQIRRYKTSDGLPIIDAVDRKVGSTANTALARLPEILAFEESLFGPYPFESAGDVVTSRQTGFALETQTRPVYDPRFFDEPPEDALSVIVHEQAHQWFGDSVALRRWQDIWLNEGFATYAEWLWSEHVGGSTPAEIFSALACMPADAPIWDPPPGAPGADQLFAESTYERGAMTLQALRTAIGDRAFFTVLRRWAAEHRGSTGTTGQFIALAERVSGRQLDALFQKWLFTAGKPVACTRPPAARGLVPNSAPTGSLLRRPPVPR